MVEDKYSGKEAPSDDTEPTSNGMRFSGCVRIGEDAEVPSKNLVGATSTVIAANELDTDG